MPPDLVIIPCLSDNYSYLLHDPQTGATAVVDVPDAAPVLAMLKGRDWTLSHILITHHHSDHIDGVAEVQKATGAAVIGAAADAHRLPPLTRTVVEGDVIDVGNLALSVIEVPGHTIGHIAYHCAAAEIAFTADSLMAAGCGRLFEGTPAQMFESLAKLAALPEDTLICSGHEYTQSNIRFALSLEPDNPELILRCEATNKSRAKGVPTVPVPLYDELETNPFLRAHLPSLKAAVGMKDATDVAVFAEIRARKDRF